MNVIPKDVLLVGRTFLECVARREASRFLEATGSGVKSLLDGSNTIINYDETKIFVVENAEFMCVDASPLSTKDDPWAIWHFCGNIATVSW